MSARRRLFRLHQSVGVALAAILVVIAATGAALVFRGCAREAAPAAPEVASPLGLEALLARAQAAAGGEVVTDIGLPASPGEAWVFYLDDDAETILYLAGDGALLERRASAGGWTQLLFRLHTGELIGWPGQALALLAGVGSLALVASGAGMIVSRVRARRR